jgi:hypothetical protein
MQWTAARLFGMTAIGCGSFLMGIRYVTNEQYKAKFEKINSPLLLQELECTSEKLTKTRETLDHQLKEARLAQMELLAKITLIPDYKKLPMLDEIQKEVAIAHHTLEDVDQVLNSKRQSLETEINKNLNLKYTQAAQDKIQTHQERIKELKDLLQTELDDLKQARTKEEVQQKENIETQHFELIKDQVKKLEEVQKALNEVKSDSKRLEEIDTVKRMILNNLMKKKIK